LLDASDSNNPKYALASDLLSVQDDIARANISLTALRTAQSGGLIVDNIVDGMVDAFQGQTGVDATASTNELYSTVGKYYHNGDVTVTVPTGSDWTMRGTGDTYASGQVSSTTSGGSYTTEQISSEDDFQIEFKMNGSVTSDHTIIGIFDEAEIATAASGGAIISLGMETMTNSLWFESGTSNIYFGSSSVSATSMADTTNTFAFIRTSGTIKLRNITTASDVYTWAGTFSQRFHMAIGGGGTQTTQSIEFNAGSSTADMSRGVCWIHGTFPTRYGLCYNLGGRYCRRNAKQ